ncbi:LysE family translocator [Bacillus aerolatus]|uniref:LysE family translocator n=1 Tax=Bacillus aerolatus TaxID=2653354 RepID=A0A6I1FJY8_9BACI|nr:LysE family translocator [Bacillus aerolatus]KAB7709018.1 LysE family translocator [Bacillus aerolatus]
MINVITFVIMSFFLVILPGPDNVILTRNTLKEGSKGGLQTILGICLALLVHTFIAVVGLSAIIASSAYLFSIFKFVGAAYLIYLGIMAFLSVRKDKINMNTLNKDHKATNENLFRQGFLTDLLNPKVAVFFLTFLPQFVEPNINSFFPLLMLGLIYVGLTFLYSLFFILLIDQISGFMQKHSTQKIIQGVSGAVLVGFGLKLAFEKNPT